MSELIEVLKQEHQRQIGWVKSKRDVVNNWLTKNSYDYSKSLPKNYIIPDAMRAKAMKWYRILFIAGIILALYL